MKKYLLLVFCLLSFAFTKAQTYSSGHIHVVVTDSMWHDSTSCTARCNILYNITVDSSYIGDVVTIVDTFDGTLVGTPHVNTSGSSPWTFSTTAFNYTGYDIYLPSGLASTIYFIAPTTKVTSTIDTLRYIATSDSFFVANPCSCSSVTGRVYADNNANCIFDSGDVGLNLPLFVGETFISPGSGGVYGHESYLSLGSYSINLQQSWMSSCTVYLPSSYAFIFPSSLCFSSSYTFTTLPQTHVDFPLQCTSNIDVQCYALSPGRVRLHKSFYMQPYVSNTGCDSASGELTLVKDSRVHYDPLLSSHPADTVRGDTLIWNYFGLSNLSSGAYWNSFMSDISLMPDSTLVVGDSLCFRVYTNIPFADINPYNNDYSFCLPVVYSYDPNSKEVSPAGTGPEGYIPNGADTLTYTIHFQNTGSDVAENIRVVDTLDSHINPKTLRILGTSHTMTPKWLTSNVVEFDYNEINLPDSGSNEPASHGEVRFSVVLNPGQHAGTQIKNTGYIYFDANPPVITNTTLSTIVEPNGIKSIVANTEVAVYPNPATDHIIVEGLNGGELSIMNISGSVVIRQNIVADKTSIDVSRLPPGVYVLKTLSSTNATTAKFTKY